MKRGADVAQRVMVHTPTGPVTKRRQKLQPAAETRVSSKSYQGLSDVEILDKLLQPDVFVVTDDGVPQMRAIEAGYRSDTLYQQGQLT